MPDVPVVLEYEEMLVYIEEDDIDVPPVFDDVTFPAIDHLDDFPDVDLVRFPLDCRF